MVLAEDDPSRPLNATLAIDAELTRQFRYQAKAEFLEWPDSAEDETNTHGRDMFDSFCRSCSEYMSTHSDSWHDELDTIEKRRELVIQQEPLRSHIQRSDDRYKTQEWSTVLGRYPDTHAVCRYFRMYFWYAVLYSLGETRSSVNDWEDLAYAFTATYVGRIATDDDRLSRMLASLYPHVELYESP